MPLQFVIGTDADLVTGRSGRKLVDSSDQQSIDVDPAAAGSDAID